MSNLYLMTTIIDRKSYKKYSTVFKDCALEIGFSMLGEGTVSTDILNYLGLEGSEKALFLNVIDDEKWDTVKHELRHKLQIDAPGEGISFIIPLSSVAGRKALNFLSNSENFEKGDEQTMKGTDYELIVVIANAGYIEMIMDAAREAGAYGGTVFKAKGTGMHLAEKFLGVSIAEEKEIIYIVSKTEDKNDIMTSIIKNAGAGTPASAICFSLPVTDTAGLRLMED